MGKRSNIYIHVMEFEPIQIYDFLAIFALSGYLVQYSWRYKIRKLNSISILSYLSVTFFLRTQVQNPHNVIIAIYGIELNEKGFSIIVPVIQPEYFIKN